jgi:CubicO group peptidase (beta-lactamase class C family)
MTKHATFYWSLCLLAATALVGGHQLVGAAPPQDNAPLDERVAAIVKSEMLAKGVPSVAVAVMRDGKMVLQRAWGHADVGKKTKADISTTYQIASSTKQFTAALVLKQVDKGRLSLDDSITKHVSSLKPEFDPITIEQLLNHTSGLGNDYREPAIRLETRTPAQLLSLVAARSLANKPGTTFLYSNTGYALLGMLVEKLYGKSYADALRDEIATALGLTLAKCADPRPGEATGYRRAEDGTLGPPPGLHHSQMLGVGGICATPGDLVKWTHALHTGKVLKSATYTAMTTPRGVAAASNYGFGSYVRPAAWGGIIITHGGQTTTGHVSELQWYPKESVAYSLLYNAAPRVPGISDLVRRIVLGVPMPKPGGGL